MRERKKNSIILTIILLIIIAYLIIYFILINSKANEDDKSLLDTVGNIISLIISAITFYYVYATFWRNKNEVEFNRLLDITYRQIDLIVDYYNSTPILQLLNKKSGLSEKEHLKNLAEVILHDKEAFDNDIYELSRKFTVLKMVYYSGDLSLKEINTLRKICVFNLGKIISDVKKLREINSEFNDRMADTIYISVLGIESLKEKVTTDNLVELKKLGRYLTDEDN